MPRPPDRVYDPYDYAIDADPHPVWRRLRDEAPCSRKARYGAMATNSKTTPGSFTRRSSESRIRSGGNSWIWSM